MLVGAQYRLPGEHRRHTPSPGVCIWGCKGKGFTTMSVRGEVVNDSVAEPSGWSPFDTKGNTTHCTEVSITSHPRVCTRQFPPLLVGVPVHVA